MKIPSIQGQFLHQLRADGVKANKYPFCRKRPRYEALTAYLSACADEFQFVAQALHGKGTEAGLQACSGKLGVTRALHCYERVAYDEYELPNIATLVIEVDGSKIDIPTAHTCQLDVGSRVGEHQSIRAPEHQSTSGCGACARHPSAGAQPILHSNSSFELFSN